MNINFTHISTVMKNAEMKAKYQLRKRGIEPEEKTEKQRQIENIQQQMEKIRQGDKIASLDAKMRAGGELTDEEFEYLKTENPELYKEAIEVKKEREQYRRELESCRTKDDVERLNSAKTQQFMTQIKAIKQNPNIPVSEKKKQLDQLQRRSAAIMADHTKFISSKEYMELPTQEEVRDGEKKEKTEIKQNSMNAVQTILRAAITELGDLTVKKQIDIKM